MRKQKNILASPAALLIPAFAMLALVMSCAQSEAGDRDLSSTMPTLGSLTTGSTSVSVTPAFYWQDVKGATSFDLYLSTESTAGSVPYASGLTSMPYTPSTPLSYGTRYYWKLVAMNEGSTSLPSEIRSFTTMKAPGYVAPTYLSPSDGSTAYPIGGFSWASVTGATNYRFLCSTRTDAADFLAWDKGTATSETASGIFFFPGYTWYWKVIAEDATACSSDTSALWSFSTPASGIAAPSGMAVNASYLISWTAVGGASKYFVLLNYGGTNFTAGSLAYPIAATDATYDASWLGSGTIGYTVVALDAAGHTSYAASLAAAKTFSK